MLLHKAELRRRVEARRKKLVLDLVRLRAAAGGEECEQADELERALDQIGFDLQVGWDNLSKEKLRKLKDWLTEG